MQRLLPLQPASRRLLYTATPRLSAFTQESASSSASATAPLASTSSLPPFGTPTAASKAETEQVELLGRLARLVMRDGKLLRSHAALRTMLNSLSLSNPGTRPANLLTAALERASPSVRLVGRRKGTKSLPTPQPLTERQRERQAWLWIVQASEARKGTEKDFGRRLAGEVLAVVRGESEVLKMKDSRHQQAVTARANVGK